MMNKRIKFYMDEPYYCNVSCDVEWESYCYPGNTSGSYDAAAPDDCDFEVTEVFDVKTDLKNPPENFNDIIQQYLNDNPDVLPTNYDMEYDAL